MPGSGPGPRSAPGPGLVKCEPPSDDEDPHYHTHIHITEQQLTSQLLPIKLEREGSNEENVSTDLLHHLQCLEPAAPAATPVRARLPAPPAAPLDTLETLEPATHASHHALLASSLLLEQPALDCSDFAPLLAVKDEPLSEGEQHHPSSDDTSDSGGGGAGGAGGARGSPKSWSQRDMDSALDALRNHHMSLTKASGVFGIPSTTLWQRAHRLGIDTPKKEAAARSWADADLRAALTALRHGHISANKASKAYGIPSSTLYKIARREGIRLSPPFNAAPTSWRRSDLWRALGAIRAGAGVARAAATYGIPPGTLYGRCKREGIDLARSNPAPWSEGAMAEALEAVRVGQMSINQAAIHYNLPYSSLYGRFKRCKYQIQVPPPPQPPPEPQPEPCAAEPYSSMFPECDQYYACTISSS